MWSEAQVLDDRYELRTRLGAGAMGQVWNAYDLRLRRNVAIKVIHPHRLAGDEDARSRDELVQRFYQEAVLIAQLRHPGIPVLYDARLGNGAGADYLVMELILGEDLASILRRGPLPQREVVSIAVQICGILAYTHADPIVHRDLKPSNIMLAEDGRIVVLDFGVATMFGTAHRRLTSEGRFVGTIEYMAPEQFDRDRLITPRSDLYSLACVLYELLAGTPPFTGNPMQVMRAHYDDVPVPLRSLRPDVEPVLEAAIMDALAKQPGDRPASADALRVRILPLLAHAGAPLVASTGGVVDLAVDLGVLRPEAEPLSVDVLLAQAEVHFDAGKFGQASDRYLELVIRLHGPDSERSPTLLECRARFAHCAMRLGHYAEALKLFRSLLHDLSSHRPLDDHLLTDVRLQVGLLLLDAGKIRAALGELTSLHEVLLATGQEEDPQMAQVRQALNRVRRSRPGF